MRYSIAFLIYMIAASPVYLVRILRGQYRASVLERLGIGISGLEDSGGPRYWIHACSVGEVETAAPLIKTIHDQNPGARVIVSTVTETGQARARALFSNCHVCYLPFDFRFAIRRHFDAVGRIKAFIIMETEIWPNLINELSERMVPIFVANGRISDHSWPRYRKWARHFAPVLKLVAHVTTRTAIDEERFRALGAEKVTTVGNIKFDRGIPDLPEDPPAGRFVIFASTHDGEEAILIRVYERLKSEYPDLRAIIAPRKIERASVISSLTSRPTARRSTGWKDEDILILDTHGELAGLYALADVAFIGGSMIRHGGHNPLEAAIHGVPVVWGPHIFNFLDACGLLSGHGGFCEETEDGIHSRIRTLLSDESMRKDLGAKARRVVLANRGAAGRTWEVIAAPNQIPDLGARRIAVRAPNWLGDAVMSLPALAALKRSRCEVVVIARASVSRVYEEYEVIETIGSYDPEAFRRARADTVILLTNSFSTAAAARTAGIKSRIGYRAYARSFLLTEAITPASGAVHHIDRYCRLVGGLGITVDNREPRLPRAGGGMISGSYVVMAPGVKYGSAKRWDDFDLLCGELVSRGKRVVLVGFRDDCRGMKFPRTDLLIDLLDRTNLDEVVKVLSDAEMVISNDSGIAHLAQALGRPTIVLFGAHDPRRTAPPGAAVVKGEAECAPCMLRVCPIDHRCMKSITVDKVLSAVESFA